MPESNEAHLLLRKGLVGLMLAGALALLLATSIFGVGRSGSLGSHDFMYFTSSGEAWMQGDSPYVVEELNIAAVRYYEGTPLEETVGFEFPLFYPPQFFPIAGLAGALPYDASRYGVAGLTIVAILGLGLVCRWCYRTGGGATGTLVGAAALGFAVAQAIGNPFGSHNIWMGQTSALAASLMLLGWVLCCRGWAWFGAAVIALGCFKPTIGVVLVPLAVLRWPKQTLIVMPIVGLATAAYPLLTQGPIEHTREWLGALGMHSEHPANNADFRHFFGVQSLVRSLGIAAPSLWPLAAIAGVALLILRNRLSDAEQAAFAVAIPLMLYKAHDYDLIVLAPVIALLAARSSRWLPGLVLLGLGTVILFVPLRLVQSVEGPAVVERYREIVAVLVVLVAIVTTLCRPAREQASSSRPDDAS